ncbi:unnamed protein product [Colias eurytheme]|nr:unnamed protein product [Colias eurytheme]
MHLLDLLKLTLLNILGITFLPTETGKIIALVNGYSFYGDNRRKTRTYWNCSKSRVCKAKFTTNEERDMFNCILEHTHKPPLYEIHNGVFIRIKRR